jgi:hypothetical protein
MIYLLIYRAVLCVHTFGQDEEEKWIEYRFSHYTGTIESSPSATEGYFPLFPYLPEIKLVILYWEGGGGNQSMAPSHSYSLLILHFFFYVHVVNVLYV